MNIAKKVKIIQRITALGKGQINIGISSNLGCYPSPGYKRGEFYLDARSENARINIGDKVYINNNCTIIADKTSITIGKNTLIGPNFFCVDSDFHSLNPLERMSNNHQCNPVIIGENVFIGANVTVLKGVIIGNNSVIAAGSVVTKSILENTIAGGCPAKTIRKF